jgi:uncharacterized membrane protein YhaH (DUF805 family)
MNSVLQAALPRSESTSVLQSRWLALGGIAVLAFAWPLFVFTGSQALYLTSIAAACCTAAALATMRTSLVVGYLAGLMALIGPEVSGQLGNGHAPLGSLRIFDAATAAAAVALLVLAWRRSRPTILAEWRHPGALAVLSALAVGYAIIRWAMEGHRVDSFLRTDVRLIVLAALFWFIASNCRRGGARTILWCFVGVGTLAAIKAAAIHYSGLFAIGAYDRLQATNYYTSGQTRTILVGGDTLLILVPAVIVLLATVEQRSSMRVALAAVGLLCLWALGLSATRTSVLVSLGLIFVTAAITVILARPHLSKRALAGGLILTAIVLGVAALGGATSRLTEAEPPHVGLNFRKDEINSFLNASATTKYLGQGLAGRFMGKNVNGKAVLTGWAHELPVWIALKTGIFGLICASLALAIMIRRALDALRRGGDRVQIVAGAVIVLGLVVMSMTLDRLALPEGIFPLIVSVFLISTAVRPPTTSAT